jgi:hypothetical protein
MNNQMKNQEEYESLIQLIIMGAITIIGIAIWLFSDNTKIGLGIFLSAIISLFLTSLTFLRRRRKRK